MRTLSLLLLTLALGACSLVGDDGPVVFRYSGPEITEADAVVVDEAGPRTWTAVHVELQSPQPVIEVRRAVLCGDECERTTALRFRGGGALPSSVAATITQREGLPDRFEERELAIARVEIQDWGPDVYSGVAYPVTSNAPNIDPAPPIVFWTDDVQVALE